MIKEFLDTKKRNAYIKTIQANNQKHELENVESECQSQMLKSHRDVQTWNELLRQLKDWRDTDKHRFKDSTEIPTVVQHQEVDEQLEQRVIDLKKCLDYSLQVQTTQKNIGRTKEMLKLLK